MKTRKTLRAKEFANESLVNLINTNEARCCHDARIFIFPLPL